MADDFTNLSDRIREYAQKPDVIRQAWAMMAVGKDKGDSAEEIMRNVIAHLLLDFHKIPTNPERN